MLPQYEPCKVPNIGAKLSRIFLSQGMMFYFKVYAPVINSSDCLSEVAVWELTTRYSTQTGLRFFWLIPF
jgi:hypothetical protein